MSVNDKNQCLLKTVKLNRFMIVNVRSSDEMRHVYSPASSSDTSDRIRLHVQAYLNNKEQRINKTPFDIVPHFVDQRIFFLLIKQKLSRTYVQV